MSAREAFSTNETALARVAGVRGKSGGGVGSPMSTVTSCEGASPTRMLTSRKLVEVVDGVEG